ncbi:MAG: septum formation initiator family protein [Treponema sp.]|jgi:cell division protein FtsB|nr:septum formation initiator family protein [Treponema sp.]
MRAFKYLAAFWTAAAVYSLTSILAGNTGISAYNQLKSERDKQRANLETLKTINRQLEGDMDALRYDSDTIAVYARDLGYGLANERFVRIVGLGGIKKQRTAPGRLVSPDYPKTFSNKTLRIGSLCAGLAVLLILGAAELLKTRRNSGGGRLHRHRAASAAGSGIPGKPPV